VRNLAELLRERPELSVRLRGAVTDADLATPERRTDRDLDDEQWRADLESRRALAISSLLQDEYEISTGRVEVEAAEPAPHQRGPGVAVVLAGSPLVDTPEIPDLAQPDRDPSTPDVSAAPE
jgi:hypothetical protein